jgi:type IV secretory pathway VirJ component
MKAAVLVGVLVCFATSVAAQDELVDDSTFFRVVLNHTTPTPPHVVLFVSGDGGWNQGVRDMSATMAALDTLVIGIDIRYYMRTLRNSEAPCSDVAGDLASLARAVERRLGYAREVAPWLAGYSSGATLVYAALVQAPPGTFQGAMSFGFCPDLPLVKPMCRGNGLEWDAIVGARGFNFRPSPLLRQPWVAFQGDIDQVCSPAATRAFVAATAHGEIVELARVGHGFAVLRNWRGQFDEVFRRLQRGEAVRK